MLSQIHALHTEHNFSGTGNKFVIVNDSSKNEHSYAHFYGHVPIGQDAILMTPFI